MDSTRSKSSELNCPPHTKSWGSNSSSMWAKTDAGGIWCQCLYINSDDPWVYYYDLDLPLWIQKSQSHSGKSQWARVPTGHQQDIHCHEIPWLISSTTKQWRRYSQMNEYDFTFTVFGNVNRHISIFPQNRSYNFYDFTISQILNGQALSLQFH